MPDQFVLVLTTVAVATEDAHRIATTLVGERLAACVNILPPMRSVYRWEGSVQQDDERQLLIKTARARVPDLQARLIELHPYDVPELLVLPIEAGSAAYLAWVAASTTREPA